MNSLRARLTLMLVIALVGSGLVAGVGLYYEAIDELNEQFGNELLTVSNNISGDSLHKPRTTAFEAQEDDDVVVQLWSIDGRLEYHSDEEQAPFPKALRDPEVLPAANDSWHSYSRRLSDGRLLQVAQPVSARREMAVDSALRLLTPLLIVLPLLTALVAWLISIQLRPLRELAARLEARAPDDTTAVAVANAPQELLPVVTELNELFARQAAEAERQRVFLADAAHELRTPVAVVKLQVQRAQAARNDDERSDAFGALALGIERLNLLVGQLLTLARSESQAMVENRKQLLRLDEKLKEWLAAMHPLAQEKNLDLGLVRADACQVFGDPNGLQSLVFNLVHNAIAYTPDHGQINVSLIVIGDAALISVSDTGPGVDAAQREEMFKRFVRGADATAMGSGLGLAIVREQAARHGGTVALLDNPAGQGLTAEVRLPLAVNSQTS